MQTLYFSRVDDDPRSGSLTACNTILHENNVVADHRDGKNIVEEIKINGSHECEQFLHARAIFQPQTGGEPSFERDFSG